MPVDLLKYDLKRTDLHHKVLDYLADWVVIMKRPIFGHIMARLVVDIR